MKMSKERVGSLLFLAVGIYGLVFSTELSFGNWTLPGPRTFPFGLSVILVVSGVLWFIQGGGKGGAAAVPANWREMTRKEATTLKIVGTTAAFILLLEPLGYIVTSALYLFLLFLWVSRYKMWIAMGLAIATGLGSWYFFEKVLTVQFPQGSLWL